MSSFAIFTDKCNEHFFIDVHFNLWNQNYDDNYLDIGIMLNNLNENQNIYLYLPFIIEQEQIYSMEESLKNDITLNAIFNENYFVGTPGQSKWIPVSNKRINNSNEENVLFKVYLLDSSNDIKKLSLKQEFNDIENINNVFKMPEKIYVRFRIKLPPNIDIINEYSRPYDFIRGAFAKNYIIDFRYNDKRSFSRSEYEVINTKYQLAKTKKLHFLLMTKVYVEVECSTEVKKRRLESNVWKNYAPNAETTDIIAYHATKKIRPEEDKDDIESWDFFAKQTVENKNWWLLIRFILITIFFGAFASMIGNHLDSFICNLIDKFLNFLISLSG